MLIADVPITIGQYESPMAADLSAASSVSARSLDGRLRAIVQEDGRVWVIFAAGQPVGMASVAPLSGLPGLYELDGFIAPAWQRRGLGSHLLQQVMADLQGTTVRQISHAFADLQSPAAQFLRRHNFTIEHEEWLLTKDNLADCLPPTNRSDLSWDTLPYAQVGRLFCRLYDASFRDFPWYQPYSETEVSAELAAARDVLFLRRGAAPIGFAWLRWPEKGLGQIEPLGIVAEEQGKGYGRYLLTVALHQLAQRGATQAQIGTWVANETAVALYQSVGFRHQETITYLACTV